MTTPQNRPVLLLAFANERDDGARYLRNLPREASGLRDVLDRGPVRDLWEVVERRNATLDEILDVFQDPRYRGRIVVFHFGGHAGSDELLLESPEGAGVSADAGIFVTFLRRQHALRLVFLNGCSTQGQVKALLAAGVPSVIATSRAIDDAIATRFAVRFYQGLSGGAGLRVAFEEAAASQLPGRNGSLRDIYRKGVDVTDERWPWELQVRDGAESIAEWNLGESAGEPLLGLPPLPALDLPAKPYRHLNWFAREHAQLFFGRGREIRELFERLTSSHTPPITLLYGQSGVGKSSLLAAGLLPRLAAVGTTRYVRRDRDTGLRSGLRQAIGVDEPSPLREGWAAAEQADGRPLIVLLDQIEEAFTRPHPGDPTEIDDFLAELCDVFLDPARRPAGKLLLGFRKEWLADIEDRLARRTLPHGKVFLDHLDSAGIVDAVAGPARMDGLRSHYRLTIEDGLPERIASDLLEDRGSPIAPALQLLLSKLWDRAVALSPEAPRFDGDLYTQLKREGVLLEDFLEQQLAALRAWHPELARVGLFLDFLAQHTTSIGSARPRSRSELETQYHHHLALLPDLVGRARELLLLVDAVGIDGDSGTEGMTRLVHDAVAQLVRRRFEQSDLPGQQARRLLERRARAWADGATGETLDDDELAAVESGLPGMRSWTPDEARIVEASRAEREARREKLRVATVIRALSTAREAQDDPLIAALLLAELAGLPEPDESIRMAIRIAERPFPSWVLEGHDLAINSVDFSPDGTLVATGSEDGTARIWALDGSGSCTVVRDHTDEVTSVAFSPDGRLLATASLDGTALLHRVDRSCGPQPLFGHVGVVLSCVFSRDGRFVATTSSDGTVRVWTCDDSADPRILAGHDGGVRLAAFNPAGDGLLTLDEAGHARVWSLAPGSDAISLPVDKPIAAAVFRSDGAVISASADGEIRAWPFPLPTPPAAHVLADATLSGSRQDAPAPGYDRQFAKPERSLARPLLCAALNGSRIAHAGVNDTVVVREVPETPPTQSEFSSSGSEPAISPMPERAVLRALGVTVLSGVFDRRGEALIARCSDGSARLWLLSEPDATELPLTHGGPGIQTMAFSPSGELVATADVDGTVRIWRVGWSAEPRWIGLAGRFATNLASIDAGDILADAHPEPPNQWSGGVESVRAPLAGGAVPTLVRRRITEVRLSPDRTRLIARVGRQLVVFGTGPAAAPLIIADDFTGVREHVVTPSGSHVLVHATDGTLHVWNLVTAEHEWRRRGLREVTLSPDGTFVLTLAADGGARLLETGSGDPVWQVSNARRAAFAGVLLAGEPPWICVGLHDGTSQLRQADAAGRVIRFSEDVTAYGMSAGGSIVFAAAIADEHGPVGTWRVPDSGVAERVDCDPPCVWASGRRSWVACMPAGGGAVTIWPVDHPDDRYVLASDAKEVQHVEARELLFALLRNGELRAWRTDRWNTGRWTAEPPGDGLLIDTDVDLFTIHPNLKAEIRSVDGTLRVLDAELTGVRRSLFPVVGRAWRPDGSWIATWSAGPDGTAPNDTHPPPHSSPRDDTGRETWLLRAVQLEPELRRITLGYIDADTRSDPRWFDDSHLLATVMDDREADAPPRLGVWDVRGFDLSADDSPQPRYQPRVLSGSPVDAEGGRFSADDRFWIYWDSLNAGWRVESLGYDVTKRLTVRRSVRAPSLNAPYDTLLRSAFDDGARLAVAHSVGGGWWVAVDHLDVPGAGGLVASGPGAVERIAFSSDGRSLDLTLGNGTTVLIPAEGPTLAWQEAPESIVHWFTAHDGSVIAALLGDGTGRVWKAEGSSPPLRLAVPGRQIRLRPARDGEAPEPDIVLGQAGDPWITATLDDGSRAVWLDDGSDTARPLTVPGRRIMEVATIGEPFDQPHQRRPDPWIAVRLDDGTARVWLTADPSSPITLSEPGRRIERLRLGHTSNVLTAVTAVEEPGGLVDRIVRAADDASEREWVIEGDRVVAAPPAAESASRAQAVIASPGGRHAIRFAEGGAVLVRCDNARVPPVPLTTTDEQRDGFQFSADGQWIVAEVTDNDESSPWALRIWNVDEPDSSRLLPHVELQGIQGNFLHIRGRRDRSTLEIIPFSGTGEPVIVPVHATAVDDETVMYLASHGRAVETPRPGIHLRRVDQSDEPIVLVPPRSEVLQARYSPNHVVARLANGEICVWDLEWSAIAARVRAATTASLTPEQRRRLLGQSGAA